MTEQDAADLVRAIREVLGFDPNAEFVRQFLACKRRLGIDDSNDLGSLVLLECIEHLQTARTIDDAELMRVLDRVFHRVVRAARSYHSRRLPLSGDEAALPEQEFETSPLLMDISALARRLSPIDLEVFERYMLDEHSTVRGVADELRISPSALSRSIARLRVEIRKMLDT